MPSEDDAFPATPAPGTAPGWIHLQPGSDDEVYWDGTEWTKRRRFKFGSPFLELPLHPSDDPAPVAPEPTAPESSAPNPLAPRPSATVLGPGGQSRVRPSPGVVLVAASPRRTYAVWPDSLATASFVVALISPYALVMHYVFSRNSSSFPGLASFLTDVFVEFWLPFALVAFGLGLAAIIRIRSSGQGGLRLAQIGVGIAVLVFILSLVSLATLRSTPILFPNAPYPLGTGTPAAEVLSTPTSLRLPTLYELQSLNPNFIDNAKYTSPPSQAPLVCGGTSPSRLLGFSAAFDVTTQQGFTVSQYAFATTKAVDGYMSKLESVPAVTTGSSCTVPVEYNGTSLPQGITKIGPGVLFELSTATYPNGSPEVFTTFAYMRRGNDVFIVREDQQNEFAFLDEMDNAIYLMTAPAHVTGGENYATNGNAGATLTPSGWKSAVSHDLLYLALNERSVAASYRVYEEHGSSSTPASEALPDLKMAAQNIFVGCDLFQDLAVAPSEKLNFDVSSVITSCINYGNVNVRDLTTLAAYGATRAEHDDASGLAALKASVSILQRDVRG